MDKIDRRLDIGGHGNEHTRPSRAAAVDVAGWWAGRVRIPGGRVRTGDGSGRDGRDLTMRRVRADHTVREAVSDLRRSD